MRVLKTINMTKKKVKVSQPFEHVPRYGLGDSTSMFVCAAVRNSALENRPIERYSFECSAGNTIKGKHLHFHRGFEKIFFQIFTQASIVCALFAAASAVYDFFQT